MQMATLTAIIMLTCIACFIAVNGHNILKERKRRQNAKAYAEVDHPSGVAVTTAAICTLIYFLETLFYSLLAFADPSLLRNNSVLARSYGYAAIPLLAGMILTVLGYSLFLWSVVVRGRYATSWSMVEDHKLITCGPYKYVRNPSYLGYFLMFFGLFALWPNLFTLFPLTAIPGYYRIALKEEELLTRRFGNEYLEYKRKVGRFLPKRRQRL